MPMEDVNPLMVAEAYLRMSDDVVRDVEALKREVAISVKTILVDIEDARVDFLRYIAEKTLPADAKLDQFKGHFIAGPLGVQFDPDNDEHRDLFYVFNAPGLADSSYEWSAVRTSSLFEQQ